MKKNVILTGFMGTGKTTVGRLLAQQINYTFVDTDALIEAKHGPIPEIFANQGEAAFRQMERDVAQQLAKQTSHLIATGGRLMLDPINTAVLSQNGYIFCLTAPADEIVTRITKDGAGTKRPLLATPDPAAQVYTLLQEREPLYAQFTQIDTSGKTAVDVAQQILALLN